VDPEDPTAARWDKAALAGTAGCSRWLHTAVKGCHAKHRSRFGIVERHPFDGAGDYLTVGLACGRGADINQMIGQISW
jgi:hypothetical protein